MVNAIWNLKKDINYILFYLIICVLKVRLPFNDRWLRVVEGYFVSKTYLKQHVENISTVKLGYCQLRGTNEYTSLYP